MIQDVKNDQILQDWSLKASTTQGEKKPFTGDNHHGLLQYKNGLLQPNFKNWSTTVNSGHFPADLKQKLANTGQNKQKFGLHK